MAEQDNRCPGMVRRFPRLRIDEFSDSIGDLLHQTRQDAPEGILATEYTDTFGETAMVIASVGTMSARILAMALDIAAGELEGAKTLELQ